MPLRWVLSARVPAHVLVVLDEAYIEYAEGQELPDGLAYLADYPNLLVSRTFSRPMAWRPCASATPSARR